MQEADDADFRDAIQENEAVLVRLAANLIVMETIIRAAARAESEGRPVKFCSDVEFALLSDDPQACVVGFDEPSTATSQISAGVDSGMML